MKSFDELMEMASRGDRTNVDLFSDAAMNKKEKTSECTDDGRTSDDVYKNLSKVSMLLFSFGKCTGTSVGNVKSAYCYFFMR